VIPCLLLALIGPPGCSPPPIRSAPGPDRVERPEDVTGTLAIAYWRRVDENGRGEPIFEEQIRAAMIELAGRLALQEIVLDRILARECIANRITLTEDDLRREEALLRRQLDPDPDRAVRLLGMLRDREGLGPARFDSLLRRNASLRALVGDRVVISDAAVRAAWDRDHGPRREARVIVVDDLRGAREALRLLEAGTPFAEVAVRLSTDASRSTGGLVDPVSRHDPSWPTSFRQALWSLEPGEVSTPMLIDDACVLVRCGDELPGDGTTLEAGRAAAVEIARTAQERLLMDELARRLLDDVDVNAIDAGLKEAWGTR